MEKYGAARIVNLLLSILGWATIGLAGLMVFGAFGQLGPGPALAMALPAALSGLVLIAVAQIASAQLDTAENTGEMVRLLREMKGSKTAAQGPEGRVEPSLSSRAPGSPIENYRGRLIKRERDGVSVDGQGFASVAAARAWIDENS